MSIGKKEKIKRIKEESRESRKIIGDVRESVNEISNKDNVVENLRGIGEFSFRIEEIKDNQRSLLFNINKELSMLALGSMWKAIELNKEVLRFKGVSKHNTKHIEDGLIPNEDIRRKILNIFYDKNGDSNSFVETELCYSMRQLDKTVKKLEEERNNKVEQVSTDKRPEWDSITSD